VSCLHAHQQNGSAEHKHRHIVEVGLTLLAHASMPLKFWDEAFITTTYLINRLPSKVIHGQTPLDRLYKHQPDYTSLRTFGCACWPNLRPYNSHTKQCMFLGYNNMHKGYKCLDVKEGRVYISRDVVFDENVFPFTDLHPNTSALLRSEILLLPPDLLNPGFGDDNSFDQSDNGSLRPSHCSLEFAGLDKAPGENSTQNGSNPAANSRHFMQVPDFPFLEGTGAEA
jgi:hypothetical protein